MMRNRQLAVYSAVAGVAVFFLFSFFFFLFHDGLPTGDSQKAILWARIVLDTGRLDYSIAPNLLNRDPVDFYTPALHYFTAGVLAVSGLSGIGLVSIIAAVGTAFVGGAIGWHISPRNIQWPVAILSIALTLTHARFLRYIREPGYHYQNAFGEFLLFSLVLLGLLLVQKWRWKLFALSVALAGLLALSHQFSAFLAGFALLPVIVALAKKYPQPAQVVIACVALFALAGIPLGLHEKIPHIFTNQPHLLSLVPEFSRYLDLMGGVWLLAGLAGLALIVRRSPAFFFTAAILLLLSQGPRIGVDIPPVRTLLYSVIPLSIAAAYLYIQLFQKLKTNKLAVLLLAGLVAIPSANSAYSAFQLSPAHRTNSTLTPGILELADSVTGSVLIDDYNRRSASWLILSGHPMFTRISADLERQQMEARQSPARRELYLNQLDFEKIFALASLPEITRLMQKHDIEFLTGIARSSQFGFEHNPALEKIAQADDIILYRPTSRLAGTEGWLLRPSTLANDIGDLEDTFEHLPASLRATRLSDPQVSGNTTYRTTTAPVIPLKFNVGDYVRILWDQDNSGYADASLQLYVRFSNAPELLEIIPAASAPIDEKGFVTLTLDNPGHLPVNIDLIALGPSPIP